MDREARRKDLKQEQWLVTTGLEYDYSDYQDWARIFWTADKGSSSYTPSLAN